MRINPTALKVIRERSGNTQTALGRRARVSQQRIADLEQDSIGVRPTTAKRLADALGVDITAITVTDQPAEVAAS